MNHAEQLGDAHYYEIAMSPTESQHRRLLELCARTNDTRAAARSSADEQLFIPGADSNHPAAEEALGDPDRRARGYQPKLIGPGIVRFHGCGRLGVAGVVDPVRTALDQLPPWAQAVFAREAGEDPSFAALVGEVPALVQARRADWADLRLEPHGWVTELAFMWDAYPTSVLARCWEGHVHGRRGLRRSEEVERLMGWR